MDNVTHIVEADQHCVTVRVPIEDILAALRERGHVFSGEPEHIRFVEANNTDSHANKVLFGMPKKMGHLEIMFIDAVCESDTASITLAPLGPMPPPQPEDTTGDELDALCGILAMVMPGQAPPREDVETWTDVERRGAAAWALATQHKTVGDMVPPPPHIKPYLDQTQEPFEEGGGVNPSTFSE